MAREKYQKMSEKDMEVVARLAIYQGKSHTEISNITGFPRRSVSHFIARQNKNHKEFWDVWDSTNHDDEFVNNMPKIFIFDIETSPVLGFVWGLWNQNLQIDRIVNDWFVMTWAGKWFGKEEVHFDTCWAHGFNTKKYFANDTEYMKNVDRKVISSLWAMLEEADMIVGHNGDKFDMRKVAARAIMHGLDPVSPVKQIDTMKIAKRTAAFTSNKLDFLAQVLCGERKVDTGGFELWRNCLEGDESAWELMLDYNINDVTILENVWIRLAPYDKKSPSFITHVDSTVTRCNSPACGSEDVVETGKTHKTNTSEFVGYKCNSCGKHMRGRKNIRSKEQMNATLMNIT